MGCSSSQPLTEENDTEEQRFSSAVLKQQQVASPACTQQLEQGREPTGKDVDKPEERRASLAESLPRSGKQESPHAANSHSSECTPPRSRSEEGGSPQDLVMHHQQPKLEQKGPSLPPHSPPPSLQVYPLVHGGIPSSRSMNSSGIPSRQRTSMSHTNDADSDWDDQCSSHYAVDEHANGKACCQLGEDVLSPTAKQNGEGGNNEYRETSSLRIEKVGGCMFVNQYLVVKFLGRGACGKVFLCLNTQDLRLYAMKAVRKVDVEASQQQQQQQRQGQKPKRNPMEDLKREIMIMKRMKHNNIVLLKEVIDDPAGSKLLLVMEFVEGGPVLTRESLEKRDKLPESLARQYFRDMVKALDYLHCNKVVHGDLKPENVLMAASGDVKLSDFGCSKIFATGNEYLERCNGTPAFLAPEMMKPNTRYRGRPTDVYALGACLYTLIFGRIPFSAPNLYKLFQVVQNEPVHYPADVPISTSLRHVLDSMLIKDPRQRITLTELMNHPWGTLNGKFPLKSTRALKPGETQEQHSEVHAEGTFAQCHPRPDFLAGIADHSTNEHTFNEGEYIMRQGDAGTFMVYITSGTVDVLMRWVQPKPTSQGANRADGAGKDEDEGGLRSGDMPGAITSEDARRHREGLTVSSRRARQFIGGLKEAGRTSRGDLLVAQKGSGELLGEMSLFSKSISRCASVRCVTRVTVRIITHEQLVEYLIKQPMAKHQIRESIWKKECEITMVEAMVKLASVHEALDASLHSQVSLFPNMRSGHTSPIMPRSPSISGANGPASANGAWANHPMSAAAAAAAAAAAPCGPCSIGPCSIGTPALSPNMRRVSPPVAMGSSGDPENASTRSTPLGVMIGDRLQHTVNSQWESGSHCAAGPQSGPASGHGLDLGAAGLGHVPGSRSAVSGALPRVVSMPHTAPQGSVHVCQPSGHSEHSNSRLMLSNNAAQHLESMAIANGNISPGVSGSHGARGMYVGPSGPGSSSQLQTMQPRPKSFSKHHLPPNLEHQMRSSMPHPAIPSPYDPYLQGEGYPAYANLGVAERGALTSPSGSSPLGHLLVPGYDSNSRSDSANHCVPPGYAHIVGGKEGGVTQDGSSYSAYLPPANGGGYPAQGDGSRRESGLNGPASMHNSGYNGNPGSRRGSGFNGPNSRRASGLVGPPLSPTAATLGSPHRNPGYNGSTPMLAPGGKGPSSRPNSGYNGPTQPPAAAGPVPGGLGTSATSRHSSGYNGPPLPALNSQFATFNGSSGQPETRPGRPFQEAGFNTRAAQAGAQPQAWAGPPPNAGLFGGASAALQMQLQLSSPTPLQKLGASAAMAGAAAYPNGAPLPPQHGGTKAAAYGAPGSGAFMPHGSQIRSPLERLGSALQHELEGWGSGPCTQ